MRALVLCVLLSGCVSIPGPRSVVDEIAKGGSGPLAGSFDEGADFFRQGSPEADARAHRGIVLEVGGHALGITDVGTSRVLQVPGLNGEPPPEAVSYYEAAEDFVTRFNVTAKCVEANRCP